MQLLHYSKVTLKFHGYGLWPYKAKVEYSLDMPPHCREVPEQLCVGVVADVPLVSKRLMGPRDCNVWKLRRVLKRSFWSLLGVPVTENTLLLFPSDTCSLKQGAALSFWSHRHLEVCWANRQLFKPSVYMAVTWVSRYFMQNVVRKTTPRASCVTLFRVPAQSPSQRV